MVLITKKKAKHFDFSLNFPALSRRYWARTLPQTLLSAEQIWRPWEITTTITFPSNCINFTHHKMHSPPSADHFLREGPSDGARCPTPAHIASPVAHPVILPPGTWHIWSVYLVVIICLMAVFPTQLKASRRESQGPFYSVSPAPNRVSGT